MALFTDSSATASFTVVNSFLIVVPFVVVLDIAIGAAGVVAIVGAKCGGVASWVMAWSCLDGGAGGTIKPSISMGDSSAVVTLDDGSGAGVVSSVVVAATFTVDCKTGGFAGRC